MAAASDLPAPMDHPLRKYRTSRGRAGTRVAYGVGAAFCVVLILGYHHDHGTTPVLLVAGCVVGLLGFVLCSERTVVNTGLDETDDGFIDRSNFSSRALRLEDIDHFDHRRVIASNWVYAVLRDGSATPVHVQHGPKVVWQDGTTHAIVDILNERLAARR